ncbi:hypothetical protein F5X96DRAFT_653805 [Biscogniauxia mediterranea]|nr:hypothetical protein F5X96DRAFT_653805 [Biscogniauxia mediterranea]
MLPSLSALILTTRSLSLLTLPPPPLPIIPSFFSSIAYSSKTASKWRLTNARSARTAALPAPLPRCAGSAIMMSTSPSQQSACCRSPALLSSPSSSSSSSSRRIRNKFTSPSMRAGASASRAQILLPPSPSCCCSPVGWWSTMGGSAAFLIPPFTARPPEVVAAAAAGTAASWWWWRGLQTMNVSLSCELRHDCWFSNSSSRVRGSDAVASWMAGSCIHSWYVTTWCAS